jgi:large-conductance mechanosensitive channel
VVDLAVAVVNGVAVGTVVKTLVENLIAPLIDAFVGAPDLFRLGCTSDGSRFAIGELTNALFSRTAVHAVSAMFRQLIS